MERIATYSIEELSLNDKPIECRIRINDNLIINILKAKERTIISLPFGNSIDFVGNKIIIHSNKPSLLDLWQKNK